MTDRVVCFLLSQRVDATFPVTYLGIAGRQVSLPRMRLRNGGEVRSGFAGSPWTTPCRASFPWPCVRRIWYQRSRQRDPHPVLANWDVPADSMTRG